MATSTPTFRLSVPTPAQIVKGVERVVAVFLVSGFAVWQAVPDKFSKAAAIAAVTAGATAVYQLLSSSVTTL